MPRNDLERACARNIGLERQAQDQSRLLSEAADRELRRIDGEMKAIRPGLTLIDPALAGRYNQLITDRAQLLRDVG